MTKRRPRGAGQVTIKDIASSLGVSHATVSRALNDSPLISEATKQRARAEADRQGYLPDPAARAMRGETSNIVGFILPDVQNHFYSAMAKALAEHLAEAGLQLVLAISEDDPERELRHVREMKRARARGIILTPAAGLLSETAQLLSEIRTVQLVRSHPSVAAPMVAADDREATRMSTRHLLKLGHRKIGYIGGGPETLDTGCNRLDGFRDAMFEVGSPLGFVRLAAPHPESGYLAAREILSATDRPSALVVGSSQLTLGVLRAIREFDFRVANDISLVSYDDPDWLSLWGPGISTIALPIAEMALAATELVCQIEKNGDSDKKPPKRQTFPVRLIDRGSCLTTSMRGN